MSLTPPREPNDSIRRLELRIAHLLRAGVYASALLMAVGWLAGWMRTLATSAQGRVGGDGALASLRVYQERPLGAELSALRMQGEWPALLCYFGLFLLVSLPVVRVFLTAVLFARQRERVLSALAAGVFVALVASFFLGVEI